MNHPSDDPGCLEVISTFDFQFSQQGRQVAYIDWNLEPWAGESGDKENSVYGEMADMIDPGDDTIGFSNAMVGSITCGDGECWTRRREGSEEDIISLSEKNHVCTVFRSTMEKELLSGWMLV